MVEIWERVSSSLIGLSDGSERMWWMIEVWRWVRKGLMMTITSRLRDEAKGGGPGQNNPQIEGG